MVAKGIHELAEELSKRGFHLTIETAGTIAPEGIACDLASISPKLRHSTPVDGEIEPAWIEKHDDRRFRPEILRAWITHYDFQLKFVWDEDSMEEIDSILENLAPVPAPKVLLMPEGITEKDLRRHEREVIELCKARGFRFCPRLHISLFGNTPGT